MNYPLVIKVLGYTLWVEAGCMVLPLLVAVYYQEPCWESFLYAAGLCAAGATLLTNVEALPRGILSSPPAASPSATPASRRITRR